MRISTILSGLALAALLLLPASASAATTIQSPGGFSIVYNADPGQVNNVTLGRTATDYVIIDAPGVTITALPPCVSVSTNVATCPAATVSSISLELDDLDDVGTIADSVTGSVGAAIFAGDGNDVITGGKNIENQLNGDNSSAGTGNDVITGGDQEDRLIDEGGNDVVTGGLGNDVYNSNGNGTDIYDAGPGNDTFLGGADPDGPDVFIGGPDRDRMDFRNRTGPITVSFNDVADDGGGCPGVGCEGDDFRSDIEDLTSGEGADTLIGNAGTNELRGDSGNDTIIGGGGADQLSGDSGEDVVSGEGGGDSIDGGDGSDQLNGGDGDDGVFANFSDGTDTYSGGAGLDTIGAGGGDTRLPLVIDLDGVADDGFVTPPRTGSAPDNVLTDVESFEGSGGDDILIGSDAANEIEGGGGDDQITGAGGADSLSGDDGADTIDAGPGADTILGGGGADALRSRDNGADQVDCGSSLDSLLADQADDPEASCENASTGLVIGAAKLAKNGKTVSLKLSCPAAEAIVCSASAKLAKGKKTVASGKGKVPAGKSKKLKLKVKGGKPKGSLTATATFTDSGGQKLTTTAKVRVG